jgi:predicted nucleotide-binding protein (sugar kinase/HSP70/actin superfamily)
MLAGGQAYGSVDPCYPSKVCQAHIHNLCRSSTTRRSRSDYIFFPRSPTSDVHRQPDGHRVRPVVSGTPSDPRRSPRRPTSSAERGISYLDTAVTLNEPLTVAADVRREWGPLPGSPPTR